jgi:hypothetical protein
MKTTLAIAVLPKIIQLADKVKVIVERISSWVKENKNLVTLIAKGALVMGAWMTIVGTGIVVVGTFMRTLAALKAVKTAYLFLTKSIWIQDQILNAMIYKQAIATKIAAVNQWLLNSAIGVGILPIVLAVAAVAALISGLVWAWKASAKFRAVILTTWETVKGFGNILKDYVIDRIKGIITGLGSMGKAIGLLFKGKFKEAFNEAKTGVKALSGYDAKMKAVTRTKALATSISGKYTTILAKEREADKPKSTAAIQANNTNIANHTAKSANTAAVNYAPVIHIGSGTAADKAQFKNILSDHKRELEQMMTEIQNKNKRLSYS